MNHAFLPFWPSLGEPRHQVPRPDRTEALAGLGCCQCNAAAVLGKDVMDKESKGSPTNERAIVPHPRCYKTGRNTPGSRLSGGASKLDAPTVSDDGQMTVCAGAERTDRPRVHRAIASRTACRAQIGTRAARERRGQRRAHHPGHVTSPSCWRWLYVSGGGLAPLSVDPRSERPSHGEILSAVVRGVARESLGVVVEVCPRSPSSRQVHPVSELWVRKRLCRRIGKWILGLVHAAVPDLRVLL